MGQIEQTHTEMHAALTLQKAAQRNQGPPDLALRADRLERTIDLLLGHRKEFHNALMADFGHRSRNVTDIADLLPTLRELRHARKQLSRWTRRDRRRLEFPLGLLGARAHVQYQPKGVVGVLSPWNYPIYLSLGPLAGIFAAGNRAMLKPSERTPETSALLAQLVAERFDPDELTVVTGGAEVAAEFSALPFDHLLFTGSTDVGRRVMRAAAENLVPLTLELGGKSPAIIGASADMGKACTAILHGKVLNAGQTCIAPDYVLLPSALKEDFVTGCRAAMAKMFPQGLRESDDYTSLLGPRQLERMQALITDARDKGAEIIALTPQGEDFTQQPHHKLPPTLILGATDDMAVMREELFGPLLPIRQVQGTQEAVAYVAQNPQPLALYYFGRDRAEERFVLEQTRSGGVSVNDTLMHIAQEDLPFGGVGASGMGRYHGRDGFLEFSHQRAVFRQMPFDLLTFLRPPYGRMFRKYMAHILRR